MRTVKKAITAAKKPAEKAAEKQLVINKELAVKIHNAFGFTLKALTKSRDISAGDASDSLETYVALNNLILEAYGEKAPETESK